MIPRFIMETSGEGLAIACKAAEIGKADFAEILALCRTVGGDRGDSDRRPALALFDDMDMDAAKKVVQHWCRDVDYQAALREIEIGRGGRA